MELKVREMTELESKSTQQIEKELLDKHEQETQESEADSTVEVKEAAAEEKQKRNIEQPKSEPVAEEEKIKEEEIQAEVKPPELDDTQVLSYIEQRYGKQITSFDELLAEREKAKSCEKMSLLTLSIKKKQEEELVTM